MNKKLVQFYNNPVISDLHDHKEIIPFIIQAIQTPGNPLRKAALKANPKATIKEIVKHLEDIAMGVQPIWKNNWVMIPMIGILVFFIAYLIHTVIISINDD